MKLPAPCDILPANPAIYESENYVVLDFEIDTSHGDYGNPVHPDNKMLLAVWRLGSGHKEYAAESAQFAQWGSEYELGLLLEHLQTADFLVAHQSKYELGWLRRAGYDLHEATVFDTKIAEYVLMGNLAAGDDTMPPRPTSLDACCRRRGLTPKDPAVDRLLKDGINPVAIPRPWLQGRCELDVETTEAVFKSQLDQLQRMSLLPVLYTRCLLTPVLADIEPIGMYLDKDRVIAEWQTYTKKLVELEQKMNDLTGGINWRSSQQVAAYIYDVLGFRELTRPGGTKPRRTPPSKRFPQGQRLTDQKSLEQLKATTTEQKTFLALRKEIGKVAAMLTKNLDFFYGVVMEYDSHFYAEFNQTTTATHRLSSSGIELVLSCLGSDPITRKAQMQNLPRVLKKLFRSRRKGWPICEADGAQLEFRVAAYLGNDSRAKADINDPDFDIHILSGSTMANILYETLLEQYREGDKKAAAIRQDGKSESFKPLYGGQKGTKKQERWYKEFRARYKDLAEVQSGWVYEVLNTKKLVTPWGLRFYWPYASISKSGYINVTSAVYNYPVQCLATAEIIPVAVAYLWHLIHRFNLQESVLLINTVHDSVIAEVHPDAVETYKQLCLHAFTHCVYYYLDKVYNLQFDVPLGMGFKAGEFWGEGEEQKFNIDPPFMGEKAA